MNFDRAFRDIEFARDFLIRKAPADAIQNIALTWRNGFRDGSAAGASFRFRSTRSLRFAGRWRRPEAVINRGT